MTDPITDRSASVNMTDDRFSPNQQAILDRLDAAAARGPRNSHLFMIGVIAIVVGLLASSLLLYGQVRATKAQRDAADSARAVAEWQRARAVTSQRRVEAQVAAAQAALGRRDLTKLAEILHVTGFEAASQLQDLQSTPPSAVSSPPVTVAPVRVDVSGAGNPQKIFIQFTGTNRETIIALNEGLKQAGWNLIGPSGQQLDSAAGRNEVRFHGEQDRLAAETLARALSAPAVWGRQVTPRQMPVIYAGTLEVWISR